MKRAAVFSFLAMSALAVHADVPPGPALPATPASEATVVISASDADAAPAANDVRCLRNTGTRTRHRDKNGCTGAPGESYGREEIDRTGATDTGEAIRRLSPSVSGHRGG